jgi:hypothetical protein
LAVVTVRPDRVLRKRSTSEAGGTTIVDDADIWPGKSRHMGGYGEGEGYLRRRTTREEIPMSLPDPVAAS